MSGWVGVVYGDKCFGHLKQQHGTDAVFVCRNQLIIVTLFFDEPVTKITWVLGRWHDL